jgi:cytoskeletal protein RodZ
MRSNVGAITTESPEPANYAVVAGQASVWGGEAATNTQAGVAAVANITAGDASTKSVKRETQKSSSSGMTYLHAQGEGVATIAEVNANAAHTTRGKVVNRRNAL